MIYDLVVNQRNNITARERCVKLKRSTHQELVEVTIVHYC